MFRIGLAACAILISGLAAFGERQHRHSPYAGQGQREIASLSATDIEDLLAGRGWGFAKPAELNGYPGPVHVLELDDALQLSKQQRTKIQAIYERMAAQARSVGVRFVEAERRLDAVFKSQAIDEAELDQRIARTESLRAQLRRIHLLAHLETAPILTAEQRHAYNSLRGYSRQGAHDHHHGTPKAD